MGVRTLAAAAAIGLALNPLSARADGAAVWKARCSQCHGETGAADAPFGKALNTPPLRGNSKVAGMTVADIVAAIKAGKKHGQLVRGKVQLPDSDLEAVAGYAKELAAKKSGGGPE
jgi:mono/diheme cytochrome c family protein